MDKRNFAFDKVNFILLAVGMAIVIIDVFSVRRIKVAPIVCLFGFLFIIYAILRKPAYTPLEEENEGVGEKKDEMSGADATINKD